MSSPAWSFSSSLSCCRILLWRCPLFFGPRHVFFCRFRIYSSPYHYHILLMPPLRSTSEAATAFSAATLFSPWCPCLILRYQPSSKVSVRCDPWVMICPWDKTLCKAYVSCCTSICRVVPSYSAGTTVVNSSQDVWRILSSRCFVKFCCFLRQQLVLWMDCRLMLYPFKTRSKLYPLSAHVIRWLYWLSLSAKPAQVINNNVATYT